MVVNWYSVLVRTRQGLHFFAVNAVPSLYWVLAVYCACKTAENGGLNRISVKKVLAWRKVCHSFTSIADVPWSTGTAFCQLDFPPSVAELFRSPPLKSGTLYRNTSSQLPRCSPSGVTLKRFYYNNVFAYSIFGEHCSVFGCWFIDRLKTFCPKSAPARTNDCQGKVS